MVPPDNANRRSHMTIEMPKPEELSDAELDAVNGGLSFQEIKKILVDAINSLTGHF
jgi:hypothetical protein